MRVLIIEDEKKTGAFVRKGLSEQGMIVDIAEDGRSGLWLAQTGQYDMAIVDVMLPELDGWSIVRSLRASGSHLPVLFLTARDTVSDRVKGLELGADDYLPKPFAFSELLARMRTILRRQPTRQAEEIRVGDLSMDLIRHRVSRQGRNLRLTPKELHLLLLLARSPGEVVSRTTIAEQVWDINFDTGTNVVEAVVRRLRAKVDGPFEPKLIHTVRGFGYVLEARSHQESS